MGQILANNPSISSTAHRALSALDNVIYYGLQLRNYTVPGITWEDQQPWDSIMCSRLYRMSQADIRLNAPKDRTLFDYK